VKPVHKNQASGHQTGNMVFPLTANPQIVQNPQVTSLAQKYQLGPEQIIFRFCHQIGIIPLTGTSDEEHMKADLNIFNFKLLDEEVSLIEAL